MINIKERFLKDIQDQQNIKCAKIVLERNNNLLIYNLAVGYSDEDYLDLLAFLDFEDYDWLDAFNPSYDPQTGDRIESTTIIWMNDDSWYAVWDGECDSCFLRYELPEIPEELLQTTIHDFDDPSAPWNLRRLH